MPDPKQKLFDRMRSRDRDLGAAHENVRFLQRAIRDRQTSIPRLTNIAAALANHHQAQVTPQEACHLSVCVLLAINTVDACNTQQEVDQLINAVYHGTQPSTDAE